MKKIFGIALCLALAAGGAHAQQVNQSGATPAKAVLTDTELTDVVLFTNGRAEKGVVLDVSSGQPVRIIQADGVVHAYSAMLVDRIIRGCSVEIMHTAAPKEVPVENSLPDTDMEEGEDYEDPLLSNPAARPIPIRRTKKAAAAGTAQARPAARRPLRVLQPAPYRGPVLQAAPRAHTPRLRPARVGKRR